MAIENRLINVPFQYEPKRQNRFYAKFPDELGINVWQIQKFNRPKMTIGKTEIGFLNTKNYVAGIYEWDEVTIDFLDPIGPSTSQAVMEWVRMHAESLTGRMGYAAGYKKNIILEALDPTTLAVEQWYLEQCQITSVDFGDNDYTSDDLAGVSVTVQPWRCILNM